MLFVCPHHQCNWNPLIPQPQQQQGAGGWAIERLCPGCETASWVINRKHWHLRMIRPQERGGNRVFWSPGTIAVEPWHSLPCTQLPFTNWQNVLLTPLKTHCRSKAAVKALGPKTEWRFTCRAFSPEKNPDGVCGMLCTARSVSTGFSKATAVPPLFKTPEKACCAVCNGHSQRQPHKFCFLHTNWKDSCFERKLFLRYILYFKGEDCWMWRDLHCSDNWKHPI